MRLSCNCLLVGLKGWGMNKCVKMGNRGEFIGFVCSSLKRLCYYIVNLLQWNFRVS